MLVVASWPVLNPPTSSYSSYFHFGRFMCTNSLLSLYKVHVHSRFAITQINCEPVTVYIAPLSCDFSLFSSFCFHCLLAPTRNVWVFIYAFLQQLIQATIFLQAHDVFSCLYPDQFSLNICLIETKQTNLRNPIKEEEIFTLFSFEE